MDRVARRRRKYRSFGRCSGQHAATKDCRRPRYQNAFTLWPRGCAGVSGVSGNLPLTAFTCHEWWSITLPASPCLLVQEARRRKTVFLGANTGLCQNPSFRHTRRAKRWLGTVRHLALSRVDFLLRSSCNQEVSGAGPRFRLECSWKRERRRLKRRPTGSLPSSASCAAGPNRARLFGRAHLGVE
jgi:hypothetical protein